MSSSISQVDVRGMRGSYLALKGLVNKIRRIDVVRHIILLALLAMTFYPFVALVLISFKSIPQFTHHPWTLTFPVYWVNYLEAWGVVGTYIYNSLIVSVASCLGVLTLSTISAYTFARFNFPGRDLLFYMIISLLMIPGILSLVPRFVLVKYLGLLDKRLGLILPYIAGGQVFGIFLLRTFFASIPEDLFEAARIDGASEHQVFFWIAIPLSKAIMGTLAIINVLSTWNDIIWPMVVISSDEKMTITVGLFTFQKEFATIWGPLFAGYLLASIPLIVLFSFTSRFFVEGLSSGALKI